MEVRLSRSCIAALLNKSMATSSLSVRCLTRIGSKSQSRSISYSPATAATPLPYPTVAGGPPSPPQQSVTTPSDRLDRKRAQAERLHQGQQARINPTKPSTALKKRFWQDVAVHETPEGLQVHLDRRPVRMANKQVLLLPPNKRALASAIALEWDQLISAQQALKHHYVPLTSLTSRALDIESADAASNSEPRDSIVKFLLRYLHTDTLLCWAPEMDPHDPENGPGGRDLRKRQREVAEPIIAYLKTHIFPGIDIEPTLGADSILPTPQPDWTVEVVRGWASGLPAFELAALERAVLASKSMLIGARLLVEWSQEFEAIRKSGSGTDGQARPRFGIEEAAEASSLEVLHQTEKWGEVEDTHDVEAADIRRQLGSVIVLVN